MENIEVKEVNVADNYAMIAAFMLELHKNEFTLNDKTAQWADIETSYMRHIMDAQKENDGMCVVAYVNDVAAGFIFGYAEEQDDSRFEINEGAELYVSDGYIMPEFRRLGLYRTLNRHLEQAFIARGIKRITRLTMVNNTGMRQLLESEGYIVTRLMYEKWL